MEKQHSPAYREHLKKGPFPGQIDPWAEAARYFQQIHSGMIDHILEQIQDPLIDRGYIAGKETSIQIIEGRQPDVFVKREGNGTVSLPSRWNYADVAAAVMVEPGVIADVPELQGIHIKDMTSNTLVTILEVISPRNKSEDYLVDEYRHRRIHLLLSQGVNVVEVDATRSVKRLLDHSYTASHHYHIAIYLPLEAPRLHLTDFGQPLKRFALPLRGDAVPVDTQNAYDHAYRRAAIAGHIQNENRYTEADLPFRSLLTDQQQKIALEQVEIWQTRLTQLS